MSTRPRCRGVRGVAARRPATIRASTAGECSHTRRASRGQHLTTAD
ncbi:hypothetical protein HSB1_40920 [Halogranum salarium B-1]|uniref:Uncharacterized protein n=1 Tax=Halogranum salarium B-1 TaxID=1210908 RepID=J3JDS0_9EURY|nr:hypothetical protein HSB1_40920 [Halogranum salarium B-1]